MGLDKAAARLGSFKEAAEELFVTQAAISHQIKALEEYLGQPLFQRLTRKVRLTEAAKSLAEELSDVFERIEAASAALTSQELSGEIKLTVAPIYGNRIILPRLGRFHAKYPDLKVRMLPSSGFVDLRKGDFNGGIRIGTGDWPGITGIHLHQIVVRPVTAPSYLEGKEPPFTPEEIAGMTLATVTNRIDDWPDWFRAAGYEPRDGFESIEYANPALAMDLAVSGLGTSLTDVVLSHEDVQAGNLVQLHPQLLRQDMSMYLVFPSGPTIDPRLTAFANWLREEVAALGEDGVEIGADLHPDP